MCAKQRTPNTCVRQSSAVSNSNGTLDFMPYGRPKQLLLVCQRMVTTRSIVQIFILVFSWGCTRNIKYRTRGQTNAIKRIYLHLVRIHTKLNENEVDGGGGGTGWEDSANASGYWNSIAIHERLNAETGQISGQWA